MKKKQVKRWRANVRLNMRVSEQQMRAWVEAAARENTSLSAWVRRVLDAASR